MVLGSLLPPEYGTLTDELLLLRTGSLMDGSCLEVQLNPVRIPPMRPVGKSVKKQD